MSEFTGRYSLNVEGNVANVGNFNADNELNVNNWKPSDVNDNLWAVPLVVSRKFISFAWWIEAIHQAFCLFPVKFLQVLNSSCLLMLENPLRALKEFLEDQLYC